MSLGPKRGWKGGYDQSHDVYTTKFSKLNLKIKIKCISYSVDFSTMVTVLVCQIQHEFYMSLNYKNL